MQRKAVNLVGTVTCFVVVCGCILCDRNCLRIRSDHRLQVGKRLNRNMIRRYDKTSFKLCLEKCEMIQSCMSINHYRDKLICQLSDSTDLLSPQALKNSIDFDYYTVREQKLQQFQCGKKICNETDSCVGLGSGMHACVPSDLRCPTGYYFNGIAKFCVKLHYENRTLAESRTSCNKQGGYLFKCSSKVRGRKLSEWLADTAGAAVDQIWIQGVSENSQPFTFYNNKRLTYTNWATGHPNTISSTIMGIVISVQSDSKWHAIEATEKRFYLCEMPLKRNKLY